MEAGFLDLPDRTIANTTCALCDQIYSGCELSLMI